MNAEPSPVNFPFRTAEEAEAFDRWFREQVNEAIADTRPSLPHDKVVAELRTLLESKREK